MYVRNSWTRKLKQTNKMVIETSVTKIYLHPRENFGEISLKSQNSKINEKAKNTYCVFIFIRLFTLLTGVF